MSAAPRPRAMTLLALAKVNLFLHITGRRFDGYHTLDSLVTFADIGDRVRIDPAPIFSFAVDGPFADAFVADEKDSGPESKNLAVRAVWRLAEKTGRTPRLRLGLTKNIPLGAGLGGGSADAAAVLWGLMEFWGIAPHAPFLSDLMMELGADVPVCLAARAAVVRGAGERLDPAPLLPEVPVVLAWPGRASNTARAFGAFRESGAPFRAPVSLREGFEDLQSLAEGLKNTGNDLLPFACAQVPDIVALIEDMAARPGCKMARMTGSGSACFGLFAREEESVAAALALAKARPKAWVRAGWLGRTARY
jgi:4-diphosphocytidyl-2-C-methyl-D-erythritol kinase